MHIQSILTQNRTRANWAANSKKRLLEKLSLLFAEQCEGVDSEELFDNLIEREKLGSTGIGKGIAIPHCRCHTGGEILGACITLDQPIPFDAIDNEPVDLLFAMLVPQDAEASHLETLASLAESMQQENFVSKLRKAKRDQDLYQVFTKSTP